VLLEDVPEDPLPLPSLLPVPFGVTTVGPVLCTPLLFELYDGTPVRADMSCCDPAIGAGVVASVVAASVATAVPLASAAA